jgi:toxin ParE1/3/4
MMRLVWLADVQWDMRELVQYYSEKASPDIAASLIQKIARSAEHLIEQPNMGVATFDDDILEWHIPSLSYTLPYRINGDDIEVLRVFHQSQKKPSKWEE